MFGWTGVFVLIVVTLPVDACLVRLVQLQEPQCVWLDRRVCSHCGHSSC